MKYDEFDFLPKKRIVMGRNRHIRMATCIERERSFCYRNKNCKILIGPKKNRDAITLPCRHNYIGGSDGFTIFDPGKFRSLAR